MVISFSVNVRSGQPGWTYRANPPRDPLRRLAPREGPGGISRSVVECPGEYIGDDISDCIDAVAGPGERGYGGLRRRTS